MNVILVNLKRKYQVRKFNSEGKDEFYGILSKLEKSKKEISNLQDEFKASKSNEDELSKIIIDHEKNLEKKSNELEQFQRDLQILRSSNDHLLFEKALNLPGLKTFSKKIDALKERMQNNDGIEEEIQDLQEKIDDLCSLIKKFIQDFQEFKISLGENDLPQVSQLKSELETLDAENFSLKSKLEKSQNILSDNEKDLSLFSESLALAKREAAIFKEKYESEVNALFHTKEELSEAKLVLETMRREAEFFKSGLHQDAIHEANFKDLYFQSEEKLKLFQSEVEEAKAKANESVHEVENKLIQSRLRNDQRNKEFAKLEETLNDFRKNLEAVSTENHTLKGKLSFLEKKYSDGKKAMKETKSKLRRKIHECEGLSEELKQLKKVFEEKIQTEEVDDSNREKEISSDNFQVSNIIQIPPSSFDAEREMLLKGLELKLQESEENLRISHTRIEALETENWQQKKEIQSFVSRMKVLEGKRSNCLQEIEKLRESVSPSKQNFDNSKWILLKKQLDSFYNSFIDSIDWQDARSPQIQIEKKLNDLICQVQDLIDGNFL